MAAPRFVLVAMMATTLLAPVARAGDDGSDAPAAPRSSAQANTAFVTDARKKFETLLPKLEASGEWCGSMSLYLQRSRIAAIIVAFEPEHERARLWLRYKRQKDGTWKQTSARAFSDDNPDAYAEWKKRRADVDAAVRESLDPLLEQTTWETAGGRSWLLHALLAMYPDDEKLRDRSGEVLVEKRWILKESAATAAGRRAVREAVRKATGGVPTANVAHIADPEWQSVSKLDLVTVRARLPSASADEIAVRTAQCIDLIRRVLGADVQPPRELEILVPANQKAFGAFLRQRAASSAAAGKYMAEQGGVEYLAQQGGCWMSPREYVSWGYDQPFRVDSVVREVMNSMHGPFGAVHEAPPWLYEGLGMYLTYALVGTRLTILHEKSAYANQEDERELADAASDWTAILRKMVEKGFDPNLPAVLTSPLNSLTKEDGLVAYVLAAYFLEGRGGDLRALMTRMRAGANIHQAIAEVCDVDAAGLQERFLRWLRETK